MSKLKLQVAQPGMRVKKITHILSFFARFLHAIISGLLFYLSYEPTGWWFCAILGAASLCLIMRPWIYTKPTVLGGAFLGFVSGLTLYLMLLPWIGSLVGSMPYIALSIALSFYSAFFGAGAVILLRSPRGIFCIPFFYVAVEFARSSWPFGGFSWVRLSWGQINGPLMFLAPIGGPALVSAAIIACGILFLYCAGHFLARRMKKGVIFSFSFVIVLIACQLGLGFNSSLSTSSGSVTVAAIQGNVPRLGLDFAAQRRAVLDNHVRQTIATPREGIDFFVWPENSSDVDPFSDARAYESIMSAVDHAGAPIILGELTRDEVGERNRVQVWNPGTGPGEYHDKKYLQPFGEYMPMRSFFRKITSLVDLASDFKPGTGNGVVHVRAATSGVQVAAGILTCYEIASDAAGMSAIENGAQILLSPTNNATFGFSDMTYQQLAISRFRAVEYDRAVVVAATSGVSAMVRPDGSVISWTRIFQPASLIENLPLNTRITFASLASYWIQWIMSIMGLLSVLYFWYRRSK